MTTKQPAAADSAAALLKPLKTARSWTEWLKRWQETEYAEDKLSLLCQAMTFPCLSYEKTTYECERDAESFNINRALFLLDVADSHVVVHGYQPDEHLCLMSEAQLRERVAETAFVALCELIFKDHNPEGALKHYQWYEWSRLRDDRLRTRILDFFRPYSDGYSIKNLWWPNRSNQVCVARARNFILAYCARLGEESVVPSFIRNAIGVKIVRILYALNRTDILLGYHEVYDEEFFELKRLILGEDRRKELNHDHIPSAFMVAENAEEADFMGSGAAATCLVLASRRRIKKRYERLVAEECRKRARLRKTKTGH